MFQNVSNYLSVIQGILVNVDSPPDADVVLVYRNNAYADLTLQVRFERGLGPWFADNLVNALLLAVGVLGGQVHRAIRLVQATEQPCESIYVLCHGKVGEDKPPPIPKLERRVFVR